MEEAGIYARELAGIDRIVQVGVAGGRVLQVSFPAEPAPEAAPEHDLLEDLEDYLERGDPESLERWRVALTVPTDQRAILEQLRAIPPGQSVSVASLAGMTPGLDGDEDADREAVRGALAANPAPILIPDHRVTGAAGATPSDVRASLRRLEGIE